MRTLIDRLDSAVSGAILAEEWQAGTPWERGYLAQAMAAFVRDVADALAAFLAEHGYRITRRQVNIGQARLTFAPAGGVAQSRRPDEVAARPGRVSVVLNGDGILTAQVEQDGRLLSTSPGPKPVGNRSGQDVAREILLAVADDLGTHF